MTDESNMFARKYYPGIDTLRGIAILMVLLYHNFSIVPLADFGFLGVDLFFVISGFLITDILLVTREPNNFVSNFYMRRVLRIFPIYYVTLLFLIFLVPVLIHVTYDVQYYRQHQSWFYIFFQNWLFILQPPEKKGLLNHFWSLAIEEQFYLLWPWVIFFAPKKNMLLYALLGLFVLTFFVRIAFLVWYTRNNLVFTFIRFDGLLVGCALAIFIRQGSIITRRLFVSIITGLALLNLLFFFSVVVYKNPLPYFPFCGYTTFSLLFGLAAYYMIQTENHKNESSWMTRIVSFLGKISFGLYVFHWPVFILLFPRLQTIIAYYLQFPYLATYLCAAFITTLTALLLSTISYRYFEKIFLRLKKNYITL